MIQLAIAALIMEFYGYDNIIKVSDEDKIRGKPKLLSENIWAVSSEFIGEATPHFAEFFHKDAFIQGYFQQSEPLVRFREKILGLFRNRDILCFPITQSGATIKDLLETPSPVELQLTDVVMHIRLGDYRGANWIIDPAPQLAILRKIRRLEPATRMIIVCQTPKTDAERNYLKLFEEFHPVMQSGTEVEDFAVLRSANRILVTKSTFSWVAAWLGEAAERWIPEPSFNELAQISETDVIYKADGYDMSGLDIPSEHLPVTGEFLQGLCEYTVLNTTKHKELHAWIDAIVPKARQLYIEDEWPAIQPQSLFVYPEDGFLHAVVSRGLKPRLLVVNNGDKQVDYDVLLPFLEANPEMYAWIHNNTVPHPRIRSIPLGEQNSLWRGGRTDWEPTVKICRSPERSCDFLYPYCKITHTSRFMWIEWMKSLRTTMPNLEVYTAPMPREEYYETLESAKAIICPRGNGLDTHRHWEVLSKGAWALVPDNHHTWCLLNEYPSLPFIPVSCPSVVFTTPVTEVPSPFHPILLRPFWITLFKSHMI